MRSRPPLLRTVLFLACAFVGAVALVLCFVRIERVVVAPGRFSGPSQAVRAARDGVIGSVVVEAGALVQPGALLALLDGRALEAERGEIAARRAGLEVRRAEAERERRHLTETLQPAERESLARALRAAELVLESARTREKRFTELSAEGLYEKAALEEAILARELAEVDLERVRSELEQRPAVEQAAVAEVEARVAEVVHALAELDEHGAELARRALLGELRAPVAGRLLAPPARELLGRAVSAGDELMRVATPGVDVFLGQLDDRGRARVREGMAARLRLEGYPWLVHGTVLARVALVAERRDEQGYLVRLELDGEGAPGPLFEGMTGQARIATAQRISVLWSIIEELFQLGPR